MSKRIVLIACCAQKLSYPAPTKELYKSPLFVNSLAYAQQLHPDAIYVLSALHYLVSLDQVIAPYNVTLSYIPPKKRKNDIQILNKKQKILWSDRVIAQLREVAKLEQDEFTILAGKEYYERLLSHLHKWQVPLGNLRQGERMAFLKAKLATRYQ